MHSSRDRLNTDEPQSAMGLPGLRGYYNRGQGRLSPVANQASFESADSRLCYLTSSEVSCA